VNQLIVRKLEPGLYRIFWKDGSQSDGAVGMLHDGRRWLAPTNWATINDDFIATTRHWKIVKAVEPIEVRG
jgi:hypothetical protein